jgi:hypothetical protein
MMDHDKMPMPIIMEKASNLSSGKKGGKKGTIQHQHKRQRSLNLDSSSFGGAVSAAHQKHLRDILLKFTTPSSS